MADLILPGNPLFDITLATPPPSWQSVAEKHNTWAWVMDATLGILRVASPSELEEYLNGGEYDEVMGEDTEEEEEGYWDDWVGWELEDLDLNEIL